MYCSETVPLLSCISFLGAKRPPKQIASTMHVKLVNLTIECWKLLKFGSLIFLFSVAMFRPHTRIILLAYGQR